MLFNNHLFFIASIVMQLIFSSLAFGQDQNQDKKWIFQDNNQKESEKKTNYAVKRKLVTKTSNNTNDFRRLMHKTNRKKNINKSTNQQIKLKL